MMEALDTAALQPEAEIAVEVPAALGRAIVFTSGKGGVGKTTTTANVGAALAAGGKRVVLVDADVGLRNLDVVLGLESRVTHHLLDVLEEKVELDQALIRDKRCERLFLLAAAQSREKEDVDGAKMKALIERLRAQFDFVLIDCPAGIEMGFKNAVIGAQHAVIVCTPEVSAVRDADRVVGLLPNDWRPELIINRVKLQLVKRGKMLSVDDVNGILHLPLLGVIADEPDVIVSTNKGEPIAFRTNSTVGSAYRTIAAKLAGKNVPAPLPRDEGGFFSALGAIFGGR
ncbi:MAG: septum site-determining protein MinD [Candidatus Baltobacteraceae bacterium]|jgi:septum site-determining protein MinD